ncbi:M23 family metallopeptidase [Streptomyces sp. MA15]|uniref:M23 family metallopeptidase n=1 Tax=Streptomyces sp. MA15 TaxID=3055061 RepID=UPI0025AF0F08|nr:M23 family metallopeptidase [Streptomyces sp. MA15]MDN3270942.1 M23 family metallopeptidase [Streptomyces sp. MA15]
MQNVPEGDDAPQPPSQTSTTAPRRRRGPGACLLIVLPGMVTLGGVFAFVSLVGGGAAVPQDGTPGQAESAVSNVDGSYVPWLRRATADCVGVTPALLAAHIDQLSGWQSDGAGLSELGVARFTDAGWKKWGRDDDGNGRSSPHDKVDAIMALGRQDCSLSKQMTGLRTKGTVNGDLAELTLAAYAVGVDEVARAGGVPSPARLFVAEVKKRLPQYSALVARNPEQGSDQAADARMQAPVATLYVTSPFGSRAHPLTGVTKLHTGVDFDAPQEAQVSAAWGGVVEFADMTPAYGYRVVIDHGTVDGKRLQTTYSHLSALQVSTGQSLSTGQAVGLAGSTGLSTGPHLHFEVLLDGQYTDPMVWLANGG